jgi:hypothetical protein
VIVPPHTEQDLLTHSSEKISCEREFRDVQGVINLVSSGVCLSFAV